jgi:acetyl-CoA C-acetyltransferase
MDLDSIDGRDRGERGRAPEVTREDPRVMGIGPPPAVRLSGARLVVSPLHELRRRGGRYGLATLCVGIGRGQSRTKVPV